MRVAFLFVFYPKRNEPLLFIKPDCVRLRKFFYDGIQAGNDPKVHLLDTLLLALDMTILDLLNEGAVVASETVATRNALLLQKHG